MIIGGHAVALHGYVRTTEDVDPLASKEDRASWKNLMASLGYALRHEGDNFLQFAPSQEYGWAVDIMLVGKPTLDQMVLDALTHTMGHAEVRFVSLPHLLALKFFVMKQRKDYRGLKDMDDVLALIQRNQMDVKSAEFKNLVLEYGEPSYMKKFSMPVGKVNQHSTPQADAQTPELEFPDWSGCDRTPRPMSVEEMHQRSEMLMRWRGNQRLRDQTRQPVPAESIL